MYRNYRFTSKSRAGLKVDDILTHVNGKLFGTVEKMAAMLEEKQMNTLTVVRFMPDERSNFGYHGKFINLVLN